MIPGQGYILPLVLPKPFADPSQFKALAGDPVAQEQKFIAALTALLCFDRDMMRARLKEVFGDLVLNFSALAESHPLFYTYYKEHFSTLFLDEAGRIELLLLV